MAGLLPPLVLMTDDDRVPDPLPAARALPRGSMVVVRSRDPGRRAALTTGLRRLNDLVVLVANDPVLAAEADGLHLSEEHAREAGHWRALHPRWLITAALHDQVPPPPQVNAAFLSPVFQTGSHPGRTALTAARANAIAAMSVTPLYALGGIDARNARLLHGFVGIAAIGSLDVQHGV